MTGTFVSLQREDHVATVRLERPEAMNAISGRVAEELTAAFDEVGRDPSTWVMVLGAAGEKAFCVGADLKERAGFSLDDFYENRKQVRAMFGALRRLPQPAVASVFGYALGGGFELALSCDIIVAAEGTELGLPEARVGLLPAGGGTQLLTRKLGTSRAKELIFLGRRIDAGLAQQLGLVAEVAPRAELESHTIKMANDICRSSPVAVREAKRAVEASIGVSLEEGIEIEHQAWERVIATRDRTEGIAAFNEKRDPEWQNG